MSRIITDIRYSLVQFFRSKQSVFFAFVFLAAFFLVVVVAASSAKATVTVVVRKAKPSIRVINLFILCGSPCGRFDEFSRLRPS